MNRIAILTSQPMVDGVPLYVVAPSVETRGRITGEVVTVPVSLPPSPTMPCPNVNCGRGVDLRDGTGAWLVCRVCGGSGTVPAPWLIAIEQWRYIASTKPTAWISCTPPLDTPSIQFRQVLVAESPAPDVLPVVDRADLTDDDGECISFEGGGKGYPVIYTDDGHDEFPTEPWAANLRPGDTVWRFTPTLLDTPIDREQCPNGACWPNAPVFERCPGCDLTGTFPLSLVEGQPTEVEM